MPEGRARKIVVVGASAAGLKAAARARRLLPSAEITVLDERSFISYGACGLPYYLSGDVDNLDVLRQMPYGTVRDPEFFRQAKGIDVRTRVRATRIDPENHLVETLALDGKEAATVPYDDLILATGAAPRRLPGVETGETVGYFHTPEDAKPLRQGLQTGQIGEVMVIGAGFIGCELAGAFAELWGCEVTLVEAENRVLPQLLDEDMASLVASELRRGGVALKTGAAVTTAVTREGKAVVTIGEEELVADRAIVAVGVVPCTDLATAAGVAVGPRDGIAVNARLETNLPGIYAAGDCVEVVHRVTGKPVLVPLGSLANRQGRVIGDNLAGSPTCFGPVVGSACVKVFDTSVAAVGISQLGAAREGINARAALGTFHDVAHYYPDHGKLYLKLVYEAETHRLLGLQAAGSREAIKRADVFSALLHRGGKLEDLLDAEFCYSPPYNAALDPLHGLGCAALNQEETGIDGVWPDTTSDGRYVLDVRLADEITDEQPSPAGAVNIPLQELRARVEELPRDRPLLIVCAYGPRSAEAARWLAAEGFRDIVYLAGGMMMQTAR